MIKLWPAKLAIALLIITIFPLSYPIYYLGKYQYVLAAAYYCTTIIIRGRAKIRDSGFFRDRHYLQSSDSHSIYFLAFFGL